MLSFKFILGFKFFELVSILFAIVPDYGNEYTTKENKIEPVLKINLIYVTGQIWFRVIFYLT